MKVYLPNFFKYFDEKNPKHIAAVQDFERLLTEKAPELLEDTSNWIRIYRTKQETVKGILLNVPFYPQTDNYKFPDETCNSSACAMFLEYLKPGSLPSGIKGDDSYLKKVLAQGSSTDHDVQTRVLKTYGLESEFRYNLGFDDLDKELANNRPVVAGILHHGPESSPTGSGHMIVIIGKTENGDYWVNDPYGNLMDGYTGPVSKGKGVIYKKKILEKRWTVKHPKDGWGRIHNPVKK